MIKLNSLPLSLSLDEATNGLDALQLIQLGRLTPFLQNNFGRETLFFYGQGLALKLYGLSFFSLRFVSVLLGTLTVPLVYRAGAALQLDALLSKKAGFSPASITGLLAAAGLAVSYWHIYFSRLGLRAILLPPLLLGLVWCFWRGWHRPTARRAALPPWSGQLWLVMAGFLLGLSLYTYLAARLLPLLLTIFAAIDLLRDRSNRRQRVAGFLLFSLTAWLTAIPLLLYFQQNPQAIGSRTQTLWIFATANPLQSFLANLSALVQIHFAAGTWLQTWPALNFISALGFLLGLVICLYRLKEPAALFLLLWWGAGMAPVLLSVQDWSGQTTLLRGIVAWPALFLISAVGLAGLAGALHRGLRQAGYRSLAGCFVHSATIFWLLLLVGGGTTVYHYFGIWANRFNNFSDHPAYMARYLNRQTGQLTLTPMMFYAENVVHFLLQARYPTLTNLEAGTLRALLSSNRPAVYLLPPESTAQATFVLLAPAAGGRGTAYLLPPLTPAQLQALSDYTAKTAPLTTVLDSEQEPIARVYPLSPAAPFLAPDDSSRKTPASASRAVEANFDEIIQLTGYQLEPATLKPGQTATLTLKWQALRPVDGDYNLFIHLFHIGQNRRYGQVNANLSGILFDAHRWPAGLTVPDLRDFTLPSDAPEGAYRFEVGLYQAASRQRLPVAGQIAPPDQSAGDSLILGKLRVQRRPPAPAQLPLASYQFGDSIALIGLDFDARKSLQPGQNLTYTLYWQALAPITENYTVFNHLLDSQGNLKAQQDNIPMQGRYPTFWWDAGEVVADAYDLPLPPDLAPGRYTLRVGLYQPETGRRLPLKNSGQDFVDLPASITIQN